MNKIKAIKAFSKSSFCTIKPISRISIATASHTNMFWYTYTFKVLIQSNQMALYSFKIRHKGAYKLLPHSRNRISVEIAFDSMRKIYAKLIFCACSKLLAAAVFPD